MAILARHLGFVKDQIGVQEKLAARFAPSSKYPSEYRVTQHMNNVVRFNELLTDMEEAEEALSNAAQRSLVDHKRPVQLQLLPEDVDGLPEDLLEELTGTSDNLEFTILQVFAELGGVASLDRILIGLYKRTGAVHKRVAITSKLYRMTQKQLVHSVTGKKGWYSREELSLELVTELFGD